MLQHYSGIELATLEDCTTSKGTRQKKHSHEEKSINKESPNIYSGIEISECKHYTGMNPRTSLRSSNTSESHSGVLTHVQQKSRQSSSIGHADPPSLPSHQTCTLKAMKPKSHSQQKMNEQDIKMYESVCYVTILVRAPSMNKIQVPCFMFSKQKMNCLAAV